MIGRFQERKCKNCKIPYVGKRQTRYCSNPCRDEVRKKQMADWERNSGRSTYEYREKQLKLPIDN